MKYAFSHFKMRPWILIILIALAVSPLYGQFLRNPTLFDDAGFFNGVIHPQYLGKIFSFEWRWLPYATFEWTRVLLGSDVKWYRLGNMALHIANSAVLYLFLLRLFKIVLPEKSAVEPVSGNGLAAPWLAFLGALIFALHPAAVYAVAYLVQRSTLIATLFTLIMWYLFLEGLVRHNRWWLIASAIAYLLAVFSKEHAIMAPAVALALLFLVHKPSRALFKQVWPIFVLYGLIAVFILFRVVESSQVIGQAYEPRAMDMVGRLAAQSSTFNPKLAYPLSILTQSFLFFKYLLIWIVPIPAWMSVDMYETFATKLWSWPHVAGFIGFIVYALAAVRLLFQRGSKGLLGFAMLCPWLLFATEFSTVRIQETFVIYRSYLWMPGLFAALPFLFENRPAKRTAALLIVLAVVMLPITWDRLRTFSDPVLLWNDAARLIKNEEKRPGMERPFYNRGISLSKQGFYREAIQDHSRAIDIYPGFSYAHHERGANHLLLHEYPEAIENFDRALALNPAYFRTYLGKALAYEALNNLDAARLNFKETCVRGMPDACVKFNSMTAAR